MSNLLNVNGSDDPAYRYKMPRLLGKVEGRGNGIKTVIVNCADISQSLHRPTAQVTKFFGCELGAQSRWNEKDDRAIVNGAFETSDLQNNLTKYIEKFVLCPDCGNPETVQEVKGKKKTAMIYLNCKACGAVNQADNAHKLCTFIVKAATEGPDASAKKKKDKKERKKKAKEAAEAGGEDPEDAEAAKKARKARKKEKKEKKEKKRKKKEKVAGDDDGEAPVASLENLTVEDTAAFEGAVERVRDFATQAPAPAAAAVAAEVAAQQTNRGLPSTDRIAIFFQAAVAGKPPAALAAHLPALALLVQQQGEGGQLEVLACVEAAVAEAEGIKKATVLSLTPLLLKAMYDEDVIEEEVVIAWADGEAETKHSRLTVTQLIINAVKGKAAPFVAWLKEADEDDDDSEEED